MNRIKLIIVTIIVLNVISCTRREKQDVLILYPNWADGISITYLAKNIIENKGYKVNLKRLEPGPIFATISRGDADIYMDAWLPYTHKDYWERFGYRLDTIGVSFNNAATGLVVPDYVNISSIEELNSNKNAFKEKIYGISSGSGIYSTTEKAVKIYQLDFTQLASSETSMITALKKAEARKEWIVITGWKPHFMWSHFKLKILEDPKQVYPVDKIITIARKGFKKDKPELTEFFHNFKLDENMLNELMMAVSEDKDPNVGAKNFYLKYKETFDSWLKEKPVIKKYEN